MVYKYIFYSLFRLAFFVGRKEEYAAYTTAVTFGLLLFINILTLSKYFDIVSKISEKSIFIFLGLASINVYFFVIKKEYKKLIDKYSQESTISKVVGISLGLVYCILTGYLFLAVLR
mgnify:CR=1 FL=1